jgi:hypothetical protein
MTRLSRDDRGQITTAVVIVGIVVVVWLGLVVVKFGQAIDEKSHFQTAADAAALAGAQQIRAQIPGRVRLFIEGAGVGAFMPDAPGLGQGAAVDFAGRAGSEVTSYSYDPFSDTVRVSVIGRDDSLVVGSPAKATATAEARVGLILDRCQIPATATSTSTSSSSTSTSVSSGTPPPAPSDIACGDLRIKMKLSSGGDEIDMSDSEILEQLIPRLKS